MRISHFPSARCNGVSLCNPEPRNLVLGQPTSTGLTAPLGDSAARQDRRQDRAACPDNRLVRIADICNLRVFEWPDIDASLEIEDARPLAGNFGSKMGKLLRWWYPHARDNLVLRVPLTAPLGRSNNP